MRSRRLCAVLMICAAQTAAAFDGRFSGDAKLSSDYLFRGIDRTDGPAAQGEVDYLTDSGFYAGAWASNARAVGGSEVDPYLGYGRTITVRNIYPVHLDAGLSGYLFPGDEADAGGHHNLDFMEAYAGWSLGPASLKAYLSPDYQNAGGIAASLRGKLRWPLMNRLDLRLEGGVNLGPGLKNYTARLTKDGRGRDYFDYAAMLDYSLPADFALAAGVAGTTLDIADGHGRSGTQPKFLLELSKRFDF